VSRTGISASAERKERAGGRSLLGDVRWQPGSDTLAAVVSYLLVLGGLYTAFRVFTTDRVAANFITFGPVTLAGFGVAVPVLYTVLVRRRRLSDLGLTFDRLLPSLLVSALLGWDTYRNTIATLDVAWTREIVPLVAMTSVVGLFEAIFFRGWLQLRFEEAFGLVPGLILGALCYSFYHVGYGMEAGEMLFLFGLGLTFGAVFRLTKSVAALWPFYTPIGGLYTNLSEGLTMPFEATYGFILTFAMMVGIVVLAARLYGRAAPNPAAADAAWSHGGSV